MNNKRRIIIAIISIIVLITVGLGVFFAYRNYTVNKTVNKAVEFIEQKEYDQALTTLNLALGEESNNEKAINLKEMINTYLDAEKLYNNNELDKASSKINEIKDYSNYNGFKDDVNSLKEKIDSANKQSKEIDNNISKVRQLIDKKNFKDAKELVNKLEKEKLNDSQKQQVSDLKGRVDSELDKEKTEETLKKATISNSATENKNNKNKNFKDMSMTELIKYVEQYKRPDETINSIEGDGTIHKGGEIDAPESEKNNDFYIVVVSDSRTADPGYYINLNNNNLYDRTWKKVN